MYINNPSLYKLYPIDPIVYSTKNLPTSPIDPELLYVKVAQELKHYGNVVPKKSKQLISDLCKGFNYCIKSNKENYQKTLIYSAKTGTSKSLSLKIYLSMLKKESSIIILSTVDQAIEYCEYINELSHDNNYARCYYSITDKNKNNSVRVEKNRLKDYRCIVISHSLFTKINQTNNLDLYRLYNNINRDLVVIDEKITMYEKFTISYDRIIDLIEYLTVMYNEYKTEEIDEIINQLMLIVLTFDELKLESETKHESFIYIDSEKKESLLIPELDFELIEFVLNLRKEERLKEFDFFTDRKSSKYNHMIQNGIKELILILKNVLSNEFIYYKNNYQQSIISINNIVQKLGASVILDATSDINEFYNVAIRYSNRSTSMVDTVNPRIYNNLTIYKAKEYLQGRSSVYKNLPKEQLNQNIEMYLNYAYEILNDDNDKLLIITHKGFKTHLESKNKNKNIVFTHWGNHVGKNDWSDCNKVMIIGWNFLNDDVHYCNAINAINDTDIVTYILNKEMLTKFKRTQLADDLIQAVMRSQARKTISEDGNCYKTDIYLFHQDNQEYNRVLEIFESQFNGATIKAWEPKGYTRVHKKTKPNKKADLILNYLTDKSSNFSDVMLSEVVVDLKIPKSTMTRIVASDYFISNLDKLGFKFKNSDGRSKYFILH